MSLTLLLNDPNSYLMVFLKEHLPYTDIIKDRWDKEAMPYGIATTSDIEWETIETAFRYRFNYLFELKRPISSAAKRATEVLDRYFISWSGWYVNGGKPYNMFFDDMTNFLQLNDPRGNLLGKEEEETLIRYCYLLRVYEQIYNSKSQLFTENPTHVLFKELILKHQITSEAQLGIAPKEDIEVLLELSKGARESFEKYFDRPVTINPPFSGSKDLDDADIDLIIGNCLIDVIVNKNSFSDEMIYRLICHALLDYSDEYKIEEVAFYSAYTPKLLSFKLSQLITDMSQGQETLETIRNKFKDLISSNRSPTRTELFMLFASAENLSLHYSVANNPKVPDEIITYLSKHKETELRCAIARNPAAPLEVLIQLAGDKNMHVRDELAENPFVPPEALTRLAKDKSKYVLQKVAYHYPIPSEVIRSLPFDKKHFVALAVASNPSTPPDVLTHLSQHEDLYVRSRVAKNPSTPLEIVMRLMHDENSWVYGGAISNPSLPTEVLIKLSQREHHRLFHLRARQNGIWEVVRDPSQSGGNPFIRPAVASNPSTPPDILTRFANDEDSSVRYRVARNPSTPPEALTHLANDEDEEVRQMIAKNLLTPPEALTHLANDESRNVRTWVAGNPSAPPEALTHLANDEDERVRSKVASNPFTPPEVLTHLANDEDRRVRIVIVFNPSIPPEVLTHLANDEEISVRSRIAYNPSIPPEVLTHLANDEEVSVRRSLVSNPSVSQELLIYLSKDLELMSRDKDTVVVTEMEKVKPDTEDLSKKDESKQMPMSKESFDELIKICNQYRQAGWFKQYKELSDEQLASTLNSLYKAEFARDLTEDNGEPIDLRVIFLDKKKTWFDDIEADVCEGEDVYVEWLNTLADLTENVFLPENITEDWESEEVIVSFTYKDKKYKIKLLDCMDYLDPMLIKGVNSVLGKQGIDSRFWFVDNGGQSALVTWASMQEREALQASRPIRLDAKAPKWWLEVREQ